jgi:AcrR family transcriptional regulator
MVILSRALFSMFTLFASNAILVGVPSSPSTAPLAPTRRTRHRAATIEEIKALARSQLAEQGAGGLSLRAIAREMGTAPSALYRYFRSSSDLISALCVDAWDSVADALAAARDTQPSREHARRWLAICQAYREWSLSNPSDFALIFGTPVPGYQADAEVVAAASRFTTIGLGVFAAAVEAGAAETDRTQVPPALEVGELWLTLIAGRASGGEARLAGIALSAWASLLGYLVAEIFGSLHGLIEDTDKLYSAHVRTVMLGMGFDPALVELCADPQA